MKLYINLSIFNKLYNNINYIISIIILLLVSILIVVSVTKKLNFGTVMYSMLLFTLLLIMFDTVGYNLLSISIPSVIYPGPSHLGLDGISNNVKNIGK